MATQAKKSSGLGITYGSDPELMLYDLERKKMVSAIFLLKNDKHSPLDLGDGIKLYADNVMAEFAFPVYNYRTELVNAFTTGLRRAQKLIGPRYRFVAKAAHEFDDEELDHPQAREAGCSPNFNAYTGKPNPPPKFTGGMRTGSFHIHVGSLMLQTKEEKDTMIMWMDVCVGVSAALFDKDGTSSVRRTLYGKAGEFRPTPYGIEYRVLGPYALRSPERMEFVLALMETAFTHAQCGHGLPKIADTVRTINECDLNTANYITERNISGSQWRSCHDLTPPDLYRDHGITP